MGINTKSHSFTFIEIIVIVGILSITLPALFAIFFVILQQQTKIVRLTQVKREGDFVVDSINSLIRNNAVAIYQDQNFSVSECSTTGSTYTNPEGNSFYFSDSYGFYFQINRVLNGGDQTYYIASQSAGASNIFLTTNKVMVSDFTISCSRSATYSAPVVTILFSLSYNTTSSKPEDKVTLNYQTHVKLKNY